MHTLIAGKTNTKDLYAWKSVELKLDIDVINNIHPPLSVGNIIKDGDINFGNTEFIYDLAVHKTYLLITKPNADIKIQLFYSTDYHSNVLHQLTIPVYTTLADTTTLHYTIDCSTF